MAKFFYKLYFVFDVESVGLHGEGFAVGWVVVDRSGKELAEGFLQVDSAYAKGEPEDREWISEHVLPHLPTPTAEVGTGREMVDFRGSFFDELQKWQAKGASFWAECGVPVESNLLAATVQDAWINRCWQMPYPLNEVASVMSASGVNPLEPRERLDRELPRHHPTADARQSARLLIEALDRLGS